MLGCPFGQRKLKNIFENLYEEPVDAFVLIGENNKNEQNFRI